MRLIDIANNIDKSMTNKADVDISWLGDMFGLNCVYIDQDRITSYWIGRWYCTDCYVGWKMYFLDNEPVAVSSQMYRRDYESMEWFGEDSLNKVRDYLMTLLSYKSEKLFDYCSLSDEVGDSFKIDFNTQILDKDNITLNGEKVEFVERVRKPEDHLEIDRELKVKLLSGEIKQVNIADLDFTYNLKK